MSRVLNFSVTSEELQSFCEQNGIGISVIEPLDSGGTRIVLNNADDVEILRKKMKASIIEGPIARSKLHVARTQPSYL